MNTKITSIKGSIVRPSSPILEVSSTQKIDYISVIDHILGLHPNNRININSLLYKLALQQWFSQVKGTKTRQNLPSWFCGFPGPPTYFNDVNGMPYFLESKVYVTINPTQIYPITPPPEPLSGEFVLQVSSLTSVLCADDICLDYGLPGSFGYAICSGSIIELGSTIDWTNAFYSVLSSIELSATAEGELLLEEWEENIESFSNNEEGGEGTNFFQNVLDINGDIIDGVVDGITDVIEGVDEYMPWNW